MSLYPDAAIDISGLSAKEVRTSRLRAEDNFIIQADYTNIDDEVEIVVQQSINGTDWDAVLDGKGEAVKLRLKPGTKGIAFEGTQVVNFIGFLNTYLRAVIYKNRATEGLIDLTISV